jgi:hypothetical protein
VIKKPVLHNLVNDYLTIWIIKEKSEVASKHYIVACDERGTTRWPSPTKTWALGGLIFEENERQRLLSIWDSIKLKLCGDKNLELKWSHFFPGHHQERMGNPLITKDHKEWRKQVKWALNELFENTNALPLTTYVRKDKSSDTVFREGQHSRKILNIDTIWVGILGQFALFLKEKNSTGEIWFDNLGSEKEQARKQEEWIRLRDGDWPVNPENQLLLKPIALNFRFFDSKTEPIIQIADFLSGIVWAASEDDQEFLMKNLDKFIPQGKRTYRLLKIE